MSNNDIPSKRNLEMLTFSVWKGQAGEGQPLIEGNYRKIVDYLDQHGVEGMIVTGTDVSSWQSLDPVSAGESIRWYEKVVVPQLKAANYRRDITVYVPKSDISVKRNTA